MIQVGTNPLQVMTTGDPVKVYNVGSATIYYKRADNVSPTSNDGSIAVNAKQWFSSPTWIVAKEAGGAQVRIEPLEGVRRRSLAPELSGSVSLNVLEYGATGDGVTDDTIPVQAALTAGKEAVVYFPPGKYQITSPLEIPASTTVEGANWRTSVVEAEGEFDLFRLVGSGDINVKRLFLRCKTAQATKGSAIDFSHGFSTDAWFDEIRIGSNFFNGIFLVGATEIGDIKFRRIRFQEFNSAVKSIHNAAIVVGSKTVRCITPSFSEVLIQGATEADIPKHFEINNTDSLQLQDVLMQTGEKGLVVGNNDTSAKRSTNLYARGLVADGCGVGFELASMFVGEIVGSHAEACGTGIVLGSELSGVNFTGGAAYACKVNGVKALTTMGPKRSVNFTGTHFVSNNENAEEASTNAGVLFETKAGGVNFSGCTFGNPEKTGGEKQLYGIVLGKESENIGIFGCRFHKNKTALFKKEGGEVNINGKSAPTEAELEVGNLKTT